VAEVDGVAVTVGTGGVNPPFDRLYREHFGFVYACLLRLGVPAAAVDDAAQDVFMTVHRLLPEFEGRSALRSWLFGILRRVAFRHRRSAQRFATKLRALASYPPTPGGIGPAESIEHAQRSALLLRALDALDDDKRAALTLHVFEDLRGPELAEILGINVDTAYSRIKAARRELSRALAQLGVADDESTLVTATRRATTADGQAPRRVVAMLAVRLGTGAGAGATGTLAGVGLKSVLAAIALGAGLTVGIALREPSVAPPTRIPTRGASPTGTSSPPPALLDDARPVPADVAAVPRATEAPRGPAIDATDRSSPPTHDRPRAVAIDDPPVDGPVDALAAALAAEVAIITAAKTALDGEDPDTALARLADHARRFPAGQLANERGGYRAVALCEAGKYAAGRGEARVFLAAHPGSSLAPRVQRACDLSSRAP
jgi:RNA polymerase sigma factor (sigma-70 family)